MASAKSRGWGRLLNSASAQSPPAMPVSNASNETVSPNSDGATQEASQTIGSARSAVIDVDVASREADSLPHDNAPTITDAAISSHRLGVEKGCARPGHATRGSAA